MGAFEQLFDPGRGEFEQKLSKKFKCPGGCMLKRRFDWYINPLNGSLFHFYCVTTCIKQLCYLQYLLYLSMWKLFGGPSRKVKKQAPGLYRFFCRRVVRLILPEKFCVIGGVWEIFHLCCAGFMVESPDLLGHLMSRQSRAREQA